MRNFAMKQSVFSTFLESERIPMSEVTIPNVPAQSLEETVKRAREDGATRMVINKNPDGTFHFVATVPD